MDISAENMNLSGDMNMTGNINMAKAKVEVIDIDSEIYPPLLKEIARPPRKLYCIGNLDLLGRRTVAIVGSRKTTAYGRNIARQISSRLSQRGITVVSGLATGIDACAHEGALEHEGSTIAVMGCGPDICYPRNNLKLKDKIHRLGLVVSEYEPQMPVKKYNFPQRNRIISGLCEATVVVQAGLKSGSMITAELAMDQDRSVFAVPGNIDSQYNLGSNKLIKDGANPVISVGDILDELGLGAISEADQGIIFGEDEKKIYKLLCERGEMSIDSLCILMGEKPVNIIKTLAIMELKGIIFSDMGKIFIAKN